LTALHCTKALRTIKPGKRKHDLLSSSVGFRHPNPEILESISKDAEAWERDEWANLLRTNDLFMDQENLNLAEENLQEREGEPSNLIKTH
jgi:hypothetical protein